MAALRVQSIDFERSRVQVDEPLTEVSGWLTRDTQKAHERPSVPSPRHCSLRSGRELRTACRTTRCS